MNSPQPAGASVEVVDDRTPGTGRRAPASGTSTRPFGKSRRAMRRGMTELGVRERNVGVRARPGDGEGLDHPLVAPVRGGGPGLRDDRERYKKRHPAFTLTVGEQSARRTGSAIPTRTSRGPVKGSLLCAQRMLSTSIRSPACQGSRLVLALYTSLMQLHDVLADRVAAPEAGGERQPIGAVGVDEELAHLGVERPLVEEGDLVEPAAPTGDRVPHHRAAALPGAQPSIGLPLELDGIGAAVALDRATVLGAERRRRPTRRSPRCSCGRASSPPARAVRRGQRAARRARPSSPPHRSPRPWWARTGTRTASGRGTRAGSSVRGACTSAGSAATSTRSTRPRRRSAAPRTPLSRSSARRWPARGTPQRPRPRRAARDRGPGPHRARRRRRARRRGARPPSSVRRRWHRLAASGSCRAADPRPTARLSRTTSRLLSAPGGGGQQFGGVLSVEQLGHVREDRMFGDRP